MHLHLIHYTAYIGERFNVSVVNMYHQSTELQHCCTYSVADTEFDRRGGTKPSLWACPLKSELRRLSVVLNTSITN